MRPNWSLLALGTLLVASGFASFLIPAGESLKNYLAGSPTGAGVAVLIAEFYSMVQRRTDKRQHDEVVGYVQPLMRELTTKHEVQLREERIVFLVGLWLWLTADGHADTIRSVFPETREWLTMAELDAARASGRKETLSIIGPQNEVSHYCQILGIKCDSEDFLSLCKRWWSPSQEPPSDAFSSVYESIKAQLSLNRQLIFKLGLDVANLAELVVLAQRSEEELFRLPIIKGQFEFVEGVVRPDSILIPLVLQQLQPIMGNLMVLTPQKPNLKQIESKISQMICELAADTRS